MLIAGKVLCWYKNCLDAPWWRAWTWKPWRRSMFTWMIWKDIQDLLQVNGGWRDKCSFMQMYIELLGYLISKDKVAVSADRIQALLDAPQPRNESQARGLLRGLVMLRRFEPNDCWKESFQESEHECFPLGRRGWEDSTQVCLNDVWSMLLQEVLSLLKQNALRSDENCLLWCSRFGSSKGSWKKRNLSFERITCLWKACSRSRSCLLRMRIWEMWWLRFLTSTFELQCGPRESNVFPDCLSRKCVHKLYSYPEFRLNEKKSAYEKFRRG